MNSVGMGFPMGMMPVPVDFAKKKAQPKHKRSSSNDEKLGHDKKQTRSLSWLPHPRRHKSLSMSSTRRGSFVGAPPGDSFGTQPYRKTSNTPSTPSTPSVDTDSDHTSSTLDSSSVATTPDLAAPSDCDFDVMLRSLSPDADADTCPELAAGHRGSVESWSDSVHSLLKETGDAFKDDPSDPTLFWLNGLPESRSLQPVRDKDEGRKLALPQLKGDSSLTESVSLQRLLLQLKDNPSKTDRPKPIRWTMDGSGWRNELGLRVQTQNLASDLAKEHVSAISALSDGSLGPFHLETLAHKLQSALPDTPASPIDNAVRQQDFSVPTPPISVSAPDDVRPVPPPKNPARFRQKKRVQLPTIPEIMSKVRVEDPDYLFLPGTALSAASPSFRHGPIKCHRRSRSKDSDTSDDSPGFDSVAFQTAMHGSPGDLTTGMYDDEKLQIEDDLSCWWDSLGFESYGKLVKPVGSPAESAFSDSSAGSDMPIPVQSEMGPRMPMRFYNGSRARQPGELRRPRSDEGGTVVRINAHPFRY